MQSFEMGRDSFDSADFDEFSCGTDRQDDDDLAESLRP